MSIGAIGGGGAVGSAMQTSQISHVNQTSHVNSDSNAVSSSSIIDVGNKSPLSSAMIDLLSAIALSPDDNKKDDSALALALKIYTAAIISNQMSGGPAFDASNIAGGVSGATGVGGITA